MHKQSPLVTAHNDDNIKKGEILIMFKKAEIEIYDLQLNDVIVTSTPGWGDDDIWASEGLIDEE